MKKSALALNKFKLFNCSQSVFSSFAKELAIDEEMALRISSGFGGGMACAETCGAVTGAYMVIGMKYGHYNTNVLAKNNTKERIKNFNKHFIEKHGFLKCKELIGCNISTDDGLIKAKENNVFTQFCPQFIGSACDILEDDF